MGYMKNQKNLQLPTKQNIAIQIAASTISLACLWTASHHPSWVVKIAVGLIFSLSNNTLFSILHDAVHRSYAKKTWINDLGGIMAAAFQPTGFIFQRTCHLGHHVRNRTDHEIFDMYYPDDNKPLKFFQFYCILTGIYWASIPFANLMYLFFPWAYRIFKPLSKTVRSTDAAMMLPFLDHPQKYRIRAEIFFSLIFQTIMFYALDLNLQGWLTCYWLFGMHWGGLQYADHAWSVRDIKNGAWNLKVHPWIQGIFLNYHLHLAHHQNPNIPWNRLPDFVDSGEPKPSFLKIYMEMWKGPIPMNAPPPSPIDSEFKRLVET
jgi:fatty acid desaturase